MQRAPIELPSSEIAGLELSRYCQGQRRIARSLEANHLAGEGLAEVSHAHLAALGTSALPIAGALHTPQSPAMNSIARNLIVASIEDEAARRGGTTRRHIDGVGARAPSARHRFSRWGNARSGPCLRHAAPRTSRARPDRPRRFRRRIAVPLAATGELTCRGHSVRVTLAR
jgi:hypothetical protein